MELIQAIVPPLLRHAGETEIYSLVLKLNSGTRGKKPAVGELSRVLAQARVIPASRKWRKAEQSKKVPGPRFDIPPGCRAREQVASMPSGSFMNRVPPTMRAPVLKCQPGGRFGIERSGD